MAELDKDPNQIDILSGLANQTTSETEKSIETTIGLQAVLEAIEGDVKRIQNPHRRTRQTKARANNFLLMKELKS